MVKTSGLKVIAVIDVSMHGSPENLITDYVLNVKTAIGTSQKSENDNAKDRGVI